METERIRQYKVREGISPHLDVDEYGFALRRHPDKDREISHALEMIYRARTKAHTEFVGGYLDRAYEKAREAGCTLEDPGLSEEECRYILLVSFEHTFTHWNSSRI